MASSAPIPPRSDPEPEETEAEDGVDLARTLEVARLVLRGPERRPRLAATIGQRQPEYRFEPADHDPEARAALLARDGLQRALLAISSPLGI